jgi:hypothetical protein
MMSQCLGTLCDKMDDFQLRQIEEVTSEVEKK